MSELSEPARAFLALLADLPESVAREINAYLAAKSAGAAWQPPASWPGVPLRPVAVGFASTPYTITVWRAKWLKPAPASMSAPAALPCCAPRNTRRSASE